MSVNKFYVQYVHHIHNLLGGEDVVGYLSDNYIAVKTQAHGFGCNEEVHCVKVNGRVNLASPIRQAVKCQSNAVPKSQFYICRLYEYHNRWILQADGVPFTVILSSSELGVLNGALSLTHIAGHKAFVRMVITEEQYNALETPTFTSIGAHNAGYNVMRVNSKVYKFCGITLNHGVEYGGVFVTRENAQQGNLEKFAKIKTYNAEDTTCIVYQHHYTKQYFMVVVCFGAMEQVVGFYNNMKDIVQSRVTVKRMCETK